ncbi:TniQ family protein [Streptomyces benahoarensis]|uniref:LysR family transcriptional regulator n=1 Tax=Streptomyces benahoarensis TaxID=2595054 RepID=A0A553ZQ35_9ACTN|nr:TniQ family protein [Streptomyces benahoarensis]TSB31380.1 LysR family transcriptional regulator [Streptomyces benahoarensis]TSB43584.1 LysR family transcriptional regulator [Streptomyces benahoarensis]
MRELRTLAIRVLPQPGESLDSWLEALARRSSTSLSALLDALGLPVFERTHHLLVDLTNAQLQQVEAQLGLLAGYLDQTVMPADAFSRRAPHWRFCPRCLRETQGRWLTRWWLPWTFACTKHHTLLHDVCPSCLKEPRAFLPRPVHLHPSGHCMRRTGQRGICGTDLSTAPLLDLDPRHPVFEAQHDLDSLSVDRHTSAETAFAAADMPFSALMQSLSPSDLQSMSDVAQSIWERSCSEATSTRSPFGSWRVHERGRRLLTREFLHREYTVNRKTFRGIAQEYDLSARQVNKRARELNIAVSRGSRPKAIDNDWLREQYVLRVRTAEDIAQDVGINAGAILKRLKKLGIPRRPKGIHSRPALNIKLDESLPLDIRAAVEGTLHGWLRLRRFQICMAFPTSLTAATYLGIANSALAAQLGQLERDIGTSLFYRPGRHRPLRPTDRGTMLLQHLKDSRVQDLMRKTLGSNIEPMPEQDALTAASAAVDGRNVALTTLHPDAPAPQILNIPPPLQPLLDHLLAHDGPETYAFQIHSDTGVTFNTVYRQLQRLEAAGWLTSRRETRAERPDRGHLRTYYSLTAAARRAAARNPHHPCGAEENDSATGRSH